MVSQHLPNKIQNAYLYIYFSETAYIDTYTIHEDLAGLYLHMYHVLIGKLQRVNDRDKERDLHFFSKLPNEGIRMGIFILMMMMMVRTSWWVRSYV